jgi:DUF438 domain-containing protein
MSELIDNRAKRIRTLKQVIQGLHAGEDPESVKSKLRNLVRQCDASEIAAMEQELMADGVPVKQIMGMCDLHSQVVRELLVERPHAPVLSGHPVDVFRRENSALAEKTGALRKGLADLIAAALDDARVDDALLGKCRGLFNELMDVDKHYSRKENLLFPILERYGITGPSKVMWGKDDEVREFLKGLGEALAEKDSTVGEWKVVVASVAGPALDALEEMIQKEEKILLPMALQTINETEWGEIWSQSPEIGWCLVDPEGEYRPPEPQGPEIPQPVADEAERKGIALNVIQPGTARPKPSKGALVFPTGSLNLDQLEAIFRTLPVDLTFVDADDRVRFFTEGEKRIFVRPKAVIGRKVEHCHPPASVHIVEQIVSDFRAGRQNVAEFWIELKGQFVHIRYFAVRDDKGTYLGTLEVSQDLTKERSLEGERRLLQYD